MTQIEAVAIAEKEALADEAKQFWGELDLDYTIKCRFCGKKADLMTRFCHHCKEFIEFDD